MQKALFFFADICDFEHFSFYIKTLEFVLRGLYLPTKRKLLAFLDSNENTIFESFLPPLPRSQLVKVVEYLKVLANSHSKKILPALFFTKGADGEVVSEKSIFPEPRKFNFSDMNKLLGIKHKAQVDSGRLKVVDGRGSGGLKSLELELGRLKGTKEMIGVLVNHHNEVHWDGLLVVGDSVYIPTIVTTEHSFFEDIKAVCERLGMKVYKGVQLQANDSTCGAIALKCVSYFLDANKAPDLLEEKIVLSPDLLVFAESTKMWEEGVKDWALLNGVEFPFDRPPKELFSHGNDSFKGDHVKIVSDFDSSLRVQYKGGVKFDASLREGYLAQCWLSEYYMGLIAS